MSTLTLRETNIVETDLDGIYITDGEKLFFMTAEQDNMPLNPRENDCNCCTICYVRNRYLGSSKYDNDKDFADSDDLDDYLVGLKDRGTEFVSVPLYAYVHSGITISTGSFGDPWDSGCFGIAICTKEQVVNAFGNATTAELLSEITSAISLSGIHNGARLNVHYARMGEPTFNPNVITSARLIARMLQDRNSDIKFDTYHPVVSTMMPKANKNLKEFLRQWVITGAVYGGEDGFGLQFSINTLDEAARNEMFRGHSLSLQEISNIIKELPAPKKRKYTLNFAVTSKNNLDVDLMNKYFDKEKCIVKITPIHETVEAVSEGYEIVTDFDVYEKFEQPLVKDGWDVIVFVPSKEEDADRITCGNSLIALANQ